MNSKPTTILLHRNEDRHGIVCALSEYIYTKLCNEEIGNEF